MTLKHFHKKLGMVSTTISQIYARQVRVYNTQDINPYIMISHHAISITVFPDLVKIFPSLVHTSAFPYFNMADLYAPSRLLLNLILSKVASL